MKSFKQIFHESEDYLKKQSIPPENPLYGTEKDPRLDINKEYKTSEDLLMKSAMTSGDDVSYMGLKGIKGEPKFSKEELQRRRAESVKKAHTKETKTLREKRYQSHISLEGKLKEPYIDAATGEQRIHWPPHEPWIHPWNPREIVHNFVPLREDEFIVPAYPPRSKYIAVYSKTQGRTR
jgi:hypothetical protein